MKCPFCINKILFYGSDRDFSYRIIATRRAIDDIHTHFMKYAAQLHRI